MSAPLATATPVQQRSLLPDILRGLAIFGILLVNMQDFAGMNEWQQQGLDRFAQVLTDVFANGRFVSIFAMLFGWGAFSFLENKGWPLFLKRNALLLVVGLLHYILIWHGDIIHSYALMALLGIPILIHFKPKQLGIVAIVAGCWFILSLVTAVLGAMLEYGESTRTASFPALQPYETYSQIALNRFQDFPSDFLAGSLYFTPWLVLLFCLGGLAHHIKLLVSPHKNLGLLKQMRFWGLVLGLPLGLLLAWLNTHADFVSGLLVTLVRMLGGLLAALGYVGFFGVLVAENKIGGWVIFAKSGQMALSHYLTQSFIMVAVFYPYLGGQFGTWGAASCLALAIGLASLQMVIGQRWISRVGKGPAEWLLRLVLYGRARF